MASVYRKRRKVKGRSKLDDHYTGRFRLPWTTGEHSIALKTPDKQIARQRLNQHIRRLEYEREGIPVPSDWWGGTPLVLSEKLEDYKSHLKILGRGSDHIRDTTTRMETLLRENQWASIDRITPASFDNWRGRQTFSPKTLNEYLASANSFINWLIKNGVLNNNPLSAVQKLETRGKETKKRRSWTDEELRLIWNSDLYYRHSFAIAARTGLRRSELQSLLWSDVNLDCEHPFILARASTTKNKKTEAIPLIQEVVEILKALRPEKWKPEDPVLYYTIPRMERIRKDYKKLGLVYKDALGRDLDFHALRHTFATFLSKHGVTSRQLQALCRHSDPKLSANVYTDASQIGTLESVKNLPSTLECPAHSPANVDVDSLSESHPVVERIKSAITQAVENQDFSLAQSLLDTLRPVHKNGCPGWIRTSDQVINSHLLYH